MKKKEKNFHHFLREKQKILINKINASFLKKIQF